MLTVEENRANFKTLEILSYFNLLPLEVSRRSGTIRMTTQKWKIYCWYFLAVIAMCQAIHVTGRFVQCLFDDALFDLRNLVFHYIHASGCILVLIWAICLMKHPTESVIIFNELHEPLVPHEDSVDNADGKNVEETDVAEKSSTVENQEAEQGAVDIEEAAAKLPKPRKIFAWLPQFNMYELLGLQYWLVMFGSEAIILAVLFFDPSRIQFLYYSLPEDYKNWLTYVVLMGFESVGMTWTVATGYYPMLIEIQFFEKVMFDFGQLEAEVGKLMNTDRVHIPSSDISIILKRLHTQQTLIELFNRTFPFVIYSYKIWAMAISILYYFFAIRHFSEHPFLACFAVYIAVAETITYAIMFGKAFQVPEKICELKNQILLVARRSNLASWKEFQKEVQGIPNLKIRVGSFGAFESTSTIDFVDFVFGQVMDLLVTFS